MEIYSLDQKLNAKKTQKAEIRFNRPHIIIGVMVLFTTTYKLLGCITTVLCVTVGTQTIILEAKSTINRSSSRWMAGLCTVLSDWRDYYSVIYRHKVCTICIVIDVPKDFKLKHKSGISQ